VRARLEVYRRETQPLLDYYEKTGRLQQVDGLRETEAVYADLERLIKND
jgi:adenylate kinase